jgi:hypothetical protein
MSVITWERRASDRWSAFDGDSGSVVATVSRGLSQSWFATADMSLIPGVFPSADVARCAAYWFLRDQSRWMQAREWWLRQVDAALEGDGPSLTWGQVGQARRYGVWMG